jgi:hypothetical protein
MLNHYEANTQLYMSYAQFVRDQSLASANYPEACSDVMRQVSAQPQYNDDTLQCCLTCAVRSCTRNTPEVSSDVMHQNYHSTTSKWQHTGV